MNGITREEALRRVGEGWSGIIDLLYDLKPLEVVVSDVKEKYGTLRFYTWSSTEQFENVVSQIEILSENICEVCGKLGRTRFDRSWYKTLCDEHNTKP